MRRIVVLGILVGLCLPAVSAAQQAPNGEADLQAALRRMP